MNGKVVYLVFEGLFSWPRYVLALPLLVILRTHCPFTVLGLSRHGNAHLLSWVGNFKLYSGIVFLSQISIGPPQTVKCYYWKIRKDNTQLLPCIPACYRFLSWFHTLTSVLEMLEEENRGNYEEQVLAFSPLVKVGKLNVSLKSSKMKHIPPVKSDSWKIYFSSVFKFYSSQLISA